MVVELALVLLDTATVEAGPGGDRSLAVQVLAAIRGHRIAANPHPFQPDTIGDLAESALADLRRELPEGAFQQAEAAGSAKGFDIVVKELLAAEEGTLR